MLAMLAAMTSYTASHPKICALSLCLEEAGSLSTLFSPGNCGDDGASSHALGL